MPYSTIERKKCKCGCDRFPSIGYEGYFSGHAPQEVKDKVGTKAKVARKNRNKRLSIARQLRQAQTESNLDHVYKENWFKNTRRKLTGICACGCGQKSSKNDDAYFRFSCCHLFPKSKFESVQYHPLNYVERAFWGGCHTNLDEQSMDKWVNMADWEDIKEKFWLLAPLLTEEERASKFYTHLERLVYITI